MGRKDCIWLIDDDEQLTDILSLSLEAQGYDVVVSKDKETALSFLAQNAAPAPLSCVLLDLKLVDQDGLSLLPQIREDFPEIPIFIITAHGDVDSAIDAFTLGANGYLRKPFEEGELREKLRHAIDRYELKSQLRSLRKMPMLSGNAPSIHEIIPSRDPVMSALLRRVEMAANVNSNCVIYGESGTGKELVAHALHRLGHRRDAPFIAFNCAALPETLMESELFGHVKGAFTDAKENKAGLFARANGGTLLLDEIGDAPLSIQAKLLRVLQEREILPLGAAKPVKIDVRVIAATHKSLRTEVEQKRFRQDLYYRLHVLQVQIPALRERPKDILFLGSYFASELSKEMGLAFRGFTPLAQAEMESYAWPGNVRELQNRIEQAMALGSGGVIRARGLFPERELIDGVSNGFDEDVPLTETSETLPSYQEAKSSFERNYLERVLSVAKGNIAKAARLASKSRTEVYGLLKKHGLNPLLFKSPENQKRLLPPESSKEV